MILSDFSPAIQTSILHFANPKTSLAEIGSLYGISKQAAAKRIALGGAFFASYGSVAVFPERERLISLEQENAKLKSLVKHLQLIIVICNANAFLAKAFEELVHRFFPNIKLRRLSALQKKRLLDYWTKFKSLGGTMKDYCQGIGRCPSTLRGWIQSYEKYGMAGLQDKTSRPLHFSNKIPIWFKNQLLMLFLRFPHWTPYQYYKFIKGNPALHWHISLQTIAKLKLVHQEKSLAEKDRQKKLWAFAPGTGAWTVDFTCLLKTAHYKIQLLTVSDAASRFLFETALVIDTSTEMVMEHLQNLFVKYGKPSFIKADNGPEFRLECKEHLQKFCVHLFNSPVYYGQFCGAHERIHKTIKQSITDLGLHHNLSLVVLEMEQFREDYNHTLPLESQGGKTPAELYYCDDFELVRPSHVEIVTPYVKDGEIRVKFTNRFGDKSRMTVGKTPGQQVTSHLEQPGAI